MGPVISDRFRWGALAWLLTLQFFVVETVVQLRGEGHSRIDDVISDLGATAGPGLRAWHASCVWLAALILAGWRLLLPPLRSGAGRVATYLFGIAALGVLLVGVLPSDRSDTWHAVGATLYLVGGGELRGGHGWSLLSGGDADTDRRQCRNSSLQLGELLAQGGELLDGEV